MESNAPEIPHGTRNDEAGVTRQVVCHRPITPTETGGAAPRQVWPEVRLCPPSLGIGTTDAHLLAHLAPPVATRESGRTGPDRPNTAKGMTHGSGDLGEARFGNSGGSVVGSVRWRARLGRLRTNPWPLAASAGGLASRPIIWLLYGQATAAVLVTTAALLVVREALGILNILLLYLVVSFLVALMAGPGPAVIAALLAFVAFNFFFIPPYYSLSVNRAEHLLALIVYLGVSIVTGQLVARVRARTEVAVREQRRTALLYELNAALVGDVTLDAILARIVERVVHVYGARQCRILLPDTDGHLAIRAHFPPDAKDEIDPELRAVADWVMTHRQPAGQRTAGRRVRPPHGLERPLPTPMVRRGPDVLTLPIATRDHAIGVLTMVGTPGGGRFGAEDELLLGTFADQAALALERARLSEEAARAAALAQSDELKSALLSAVSHDLRTPLAAIKASATSLLDSTVPWTDQDRIEFLRAIDEETDRLTAMVSNLLDLSRIEGGALRPDKAWYDIAELVADVTDRVAGGVAATEHPLTVQIEPALPLVCFDYVEIAQVLSNLLQNAIKYTPPGTPISVFARQVPGAIELAVADRGPGISAARLPRLFEKFYRAGQEGKTSGTGIGLTIAKGLVEAHGGRMWAESREGEGTAFTFTLPVVESEPEAEVTG